MRRAWIWGLVGWGVLVGAAGAAPPAVVLVAYYSEHGSTERMARAAAEGTSRVEGCEAVVRRVEEVTQDDLRRADAIILAAPTYYANIPGRMKIVLDDWAWKWKIDFTDKLGAAVSTGGGPAAGKEHVLVSLVLYMLNNRMIVAGPLCEDPTGKDRWGEIGVTAMTGPLDPGTSAAELEAARRLGQRIAGLAIGRGRR